MVSLFVDDQPYPLDYSRDMDSTYIFRTVVANQSSESSFLRIRFAIPHTIQPSSIDMQNQDQRLLGFLLNWVDMKPITENKFLPVTKIPLAGIPWRIQEFTGMPAGQGQV